MSIFCIWSYRTSLICNKCVSVSAVSVVVSTSVLVGRLPQLCHRASRVSCSFVICARVLCRFTTYLFVSGLKKQTIAAVLAVRLK